MRSAVETVLAWHEAVNAADVEGAVACCDPEVEVGGPRGTGRGHDLVRQWLTRSGIRLAPQHPLTEDAQAPGRVVVEELARWTASDAPSAAPTEPTRTWVVYHAQHGRLTSVVRYETVEQVPTG